MKRVLQIASEWLGKAGILRSKPRELGAMGEEHAARFLKKLGMRIIARNRRCRGGEIDLIAVDGQWLVFVEVRTRSSEDFMRPEDSIRYGQKKQIVTRTVRRLIRRHKVSGLTARIDLVAIVWPPGEKEPTEVRHHRGAMTVATW
jgi:putative endonuclease